MQDYIDTVRFNDRHVIVEDGETGYPISNAPMLFTTPAFPDGPPRRLVFENRHWTSTPFLNLDNAIRYTREIGWRPQVVCTNI